MRVKFAPLLSLELKHEFYGNARSQEFAFMIPSSSSRLIAGARLLAKEHDGALTVFYEGTDNDAALVSIPGQMLRFGLRLVDPLFYNYTSLPLVAEEALPRYRNATDKRKLNAPVALRLNPTDEEYAELKWAQLFAVVDITVDAGFYDDPPKFEIQFAARKERLRYYVVTRKYSDYDFNHLAVNDTRPAGDPDHIDFVRIAASDFGSADIDADVLRGTDGRVALFRSDEDVARRASGRTGIALELNGTTLIPNLPQPSRATAGANMIVHLSKP